MSPVGVSEVRWPDMFGHCAGRHLQRLASVIYWRFPGTSADVPKPKRSPLYSLWEHRSMLFRACQHGWRCALVNAAYSTCLSSQNHSLVTIKPGNKSAKAAFISSVNIITDKCLSAAKKPKKKNVRSGLDLGFFFFFLSLTGIYIQDYLLMFSSNVRTLKRAKYERELKKKAPDLSTSCHLRFLFFF